MSRKVLIVDDSATERRFLTDLLAGNGWDVVTAENGDEGVAKTRAERPAVVLMDVVMPGVNGYQATRALSRDPGTRDIPVILCTSKGTDTDRIWGLRQGARGYLVKPIRPDELLAKLAEIVP